MKVDIVARERHFHYRVAPEADDRTEMRRSHIGDMTKVELVHREWDTELPPAFRSVHPDLHAAAVFLVLRPFIGGTLRLPFGVSPAFARGMEDVHGVALPNVDRRLAPRRHPGERAGLLFSGGYDSTAATLVLPRDAVVLHVGRIPHGLDGSAEFQRSLERHIARAEARVAMVREHGRETYVVREDHEYLFRPYPQWHTGQDLAIQAAMFMADSLGLGVIESGAVFCNVLNAGYQFDTVARWAFPDAEFASLFAPQAERPRMARKTDGDAKAAFGDQGEFWALGFRKAASVAGLSTVGTAILVVRGPYGGRACACDYKHAGDSSAWAYQPTETTCYRCDRCIQKVLLSHAIRDEAVPDSLIDHFLSFPDLAGLFRNPYFDWHHVWMWIFQRLRSNHWFVAELREQARRGPDLSFLEKWYPASRALVPRAYRDVVEENIHRYVPSMTSADIAAMRGLVLPPLHAPDLAARGWTFRYPDDTSLRAATGPAIPASAPPDPERPRDESLEARPDTLRIVLTDRHGEHPDHVFFLGALRADDRVFLRLGSVGLAHAPCPPGPVFEHAGAALRAMLAAVTEPPGPASLAAWDHALRVALARSPLAKRFDSTVTLVG